MALAIAKTSFCDYSLDLFKRKVMIMTKTFDVVSAVILAVMASVGPASAANTPSSTTASQPHAVLHANGGTVAPEDVVVCRKVLYEDDFATPAQKHACKEKLKHQQGQHSPGPR